MFSRIAQWLLDHFPWLLDRFPWLNSAVPVLEYLERLWHDNEGLIVLIGFVIVWRLLRRERLKLGERIDTLAQIVRAVRDEAEAAIGLPPASPPSAPSPQPPVSPQSPQGPAPGAQAPPPAAAADTGNVAN